MSIGNDILEIEANPEDRAKKRRGRPRRGSRPNDWNRCLLCALMYYDQRRLKIPEIMKYFKCSRDTVGDMIRCVLSSDDHTARVIQDIARKSRRRIKPKDTFC